MNSHNTTKNMRQFLSRLVVISVFGSLVVPTVLLAADWSIPVAGNAYRTERANSGRDIQRNGTIALADTDGQFSLFFHVNRPAELELAIVAQIKSRGDRQAYATLLTTVDDKTFRTNIKNGNSSTCSIGEVMVQHPGYVRVDLKCDSLKAARSLEISELKIASETKGLSLDFVKTNDGNMFYWGRRGPSVHLRYEVPRRKRIRYAYSEITVPPGSDPIGSYYMANGFSEGYFGIQVNSPNERRILFSVWSPFRTDNPNEIPKDQRIVALAKGPGVQVGKFGNEGSGGQSYLVYPWTAGKTYRFLTKVLPNGDGSTTYTSWFGDKGADEWRLIASFQRPKTDTTLKGFHSFLESFSPSFGYLGRGAQYGNTWVVDEQGNWHECVRARFSVDATGGGRHRLDFAGGADSNTFFLRNCGFIQQTGNPGETFTRESSNAQKPDIAFDDLPGFDSTTPVSDAEK
ncbi:MAG: DUF3472 domain-containing protein [Planctomycetota bacterium]|nr:DUF3472 domain-containing protein [Planctomycetota bacterium]